MKHSYYFIFLFIKCCAQGVRGPAVQRREAVPEQLCDRPAAPPGAGAAGGIHSVRGGYSQILPVDQCFGSVFI